MFYIIDTCIPHVTQSECLSLSSLLQKTEDEMSLYLKENRIDRAQIILDAEQLAESIINDTPVLEAYNHICLSPSVEHKITKSSDDYERVKYSKDNTPLVVLFQTQTDKASKAHYKRTVNAIKKYQKSKYIAFQLVTVPFKNNRSDLRSLETQILNREGVLHELAQFEDVTASEGDWNKEQEILQEAEDDGYINLDEAELEDEITPFNLDEDLGQDLEELQKDIELTSDEIETEEIELDLSEASEEPYTGPDYEEDLIEFSKDNNASSALTVSSLFKELFGELEITDDYEKNVASLTEITQRSGILNDFTARVENTTGYIEILKDIELIRESLIKIRKGSNITIPDVNTYEYICTKKMEEFELIAQRESFINSMFIPVFEEIKQIIQLTSRQAIDYVFNKTLTANTVTFSNSNDLNTDKANRIHEELSAIFDSVMNDEVVRDCISFSLKVIEDRKSSTLQSIIDNKENDIYLGNTQKHVPEGLANSVKSLESLQLDFLDLDSMRMEDMLYIQRKLLMIINKMSDYITVINQVHREASALPYSSLVASAGNRFRSTMLMYTSPIKGCGLTTTAYVDAVLHSRDKKVLLIDTTEGAAEELARLNGINNMVEVNHLVQHISEQNATPQLTIATGQVEDLFSTITFLNEHPYGVILFVTDRESQNVQFLFNQPEKYFIANNIVVDDSVDNIAGSIVQGDVVNRLVVNKATVTTAALVAEKLSFVQQSPGSLVRGLNYLDYLKEVKLKGHTVVPHELVQAVGNSYGL